MRMEPIPVGAWSLLQFAFLASLVASREVRSGQRGGGNDFGRELCNVAEFSVRNKHRILVCDRLVTSGVTDGDFDSTVRLKLDRQRRLRRRPPPGTYAQRFRSKLEQNEDHSADLENAIPHFLAPSGSERRSPHTRISDTNEIDIQTASPVQERTGDLSSTLRQGNETGRRLERRLPDAIIIGVKKGGTRALLEFLKVNPDIKAPGPEIHFFDRKYSKGLEWYRSLLPLTMDNQVTVEKTPSYFVTNSVPSRVFNMSRTVKLILVVRDPVTRAISDYTQAATKRRERRSFEQMAFLDNTTGPVATSWGAVRIGLYAKHLEKWLQYFPISQFHFVHGERLIDDPASEMALIENFLGVRRFVTAKHFYFNATKGFPCLRKLGGGGSPRCLGKTKGRVHPVVDEKVLQRLRHFYRPFNEKFYSVTGINFGWS